MPLSRAARIRAVLRVADRRIGLAPKPSLSPMADLAGPAGAFVPGTQVIAMGLSTGVEPLRHGASAQISHVEPRFGPDQRIGSRFAVRFADERRLRLAG